MDASPTPEIAAAAEHIVGGGLREWRAVSGGYTAAARFTARMAGGRRVFVKAGTSALTSASLRDEWRIYEAVRGPFLAEVVGFDASPTAPVLVDWNWAARGNPHLDLACWAPSLAMEGGPKPEVLLPRAPELAAAVSGFFGSKAGLPPEGLPLRVRDLQRRQLVEALPWAARALGLPPPRAVGR